MSYVIKRPDTLKLLDQLAAQSGKPKIDVIHAALAQTQRSIEDAPSAWEITQEFGGRFRDLADSSRGERDRDVINNLYEGRDVSR